MAALVDVADRIRSKNAGPLRLTLDVFFDDRAAYKRVSDSGVITSASVAEEYGIAESEVLGIYERDRIRAIKVTLRRPTPAGAVADVDVYGTQQHTPLLNLDVPEPAD